MFERVILLAVLMVPGVLTAGAKKIDHRKVDRELQARNAARLDNGGRIRLELLDDKVFKDRRTFPPDVVDGNVHSRQVITGVPYRFQASAEGGGFVVTDDDEGDVDGVSGVPNVVVSF